MLSSTAPASRDDAIPQSRAEPWTVLLAGGEGSRLSRLVRDIHPDARPKQFATLIGTRSMLQHTYGRARRHSPPEKILVVTTEGQEDWAYAQLPDVPHRNFLIQPRNLDTGPAICFAAAHAVSEDPHAPLLLFPTDHFIHPEAALEANILRLLAALDAFPRTSAILLGAPPEDARDGMGWILPGGPAGGGARPSLMHVRRFVEKPRPEAARRLYTAGALWNTFILGAKASSLWYLLWKRAPEIVKWVDRCHREFGGRGARGWVEKAAMLLTAFNFSRDILEREPQELLVMPLEGVSWSDWGTPEGVCRSLKRLGWTERLAECCREQAPVPG